MLTYYSTTRKTVGVLSNGRSVTLYFNTVRVQYLVGGYSGVRVPCAHLDTCGVCTTFSRVLFTILVRLGTAIAATAAFFLDHMVRHKNAARKLIGQGRGQQGVRKKRRSRPGTLVRAVSS